MELEYINQDDSICFNVNNMPVIHIFIKEFLLNCEVKSL